MSTNLESQTEKQNAIEEIANGLVMLTGLSGQDYVILKEHALETQKWVDAIFEDFYQAIASYGPQRQASSLRATIAIMKAAETVVFASYRWRESQRLEGAMAGRACSHSAPYFQSTHVRNHEPDSTNVLEEMPGDF